MNDNEHDSPVDDALIDTIVDGGMNPEELRAAILRLEREPDGWKRCAIAFLEAQALRDSFRAMGQPGKGKGEPASEILPLHPGAANAGRRHGWLRHIAAAVIVAASFAIGWFVHGTRMGKTEPDSLAGDPVARPIQPASEQLVSEPVSPPGDVRSADLDARPGDRDERLAESRRPVIRTVARIRFGPESAQAEVPVLAGPGINREWLAQQPPPVSEHGRVVLERHGYQVDQSRRYFTTVLADGRRVAVPVDHVQIQYTGNEPL